MAKIKNHSSSHKYRPKGVHPKTFDKVHWPYIPLLLVILLLLAIGLPSGRLAAAAKHPTGQVLNYATSMSISGLLSATNSSRSANGVAALSLNAKLDAAAQAKANDMASRNYWSHNTPEGNPPWVFVTDQGYSYQKLGENLAAGFSDEQSTINGWMASPPHRENLLDPVFSEVGFGFANNSNYTSAGGGPMTIVVAYYGAPQVVAAAPPPTPTAAPPTTQNIQQLSPPTASPTPEPPAPAPQPTSLQAAPQKTVAPLPVTTDSPAPKGVTLSLRSSNAQIALSRLPASSFATGMVTFALLAAGGLWFSRHLLIFRKVLIRGESYIINHPLVDIGLLLISVMAYLLSQTAGFIQ